MPQRRTQNPIRSAAEPVGVQDMTTFLSILRIDDLRVAFGTLCGAMTERVCVTLLMLAQVLACPFLDCGECGGSCEAEVLSVADTCGCCPDSEPTQNGRWPVPCQDPDCADQSCQCLCGGAVQAATVKCPDLLSRAGKSFLPKCLLNRTTSHLALSADELTAHGCPHFPPLISGSSLCAMTRVYLL